MSFLWAFRPVNILFAVLQFLAIVSAVHTESTRRSIDAAVIGKGAENIKRSLEHRDAAINQPLRHPILLVAKGNQSRYISTSLNPSRPELHFLVRSVCFTQS